MNRSFSKIRHIQESNIKLEKRLLNEQLPNNPLNLPHFNQPIDNNDCLDKKIKQISPNASFEIVSKITKPYQDELIKLSKEGFSSNFLKRFKEITETIDELLKPYNLTNEIILKIYEECGFTKNL